jgi:hypothetical protein
VNGRVLATSGFEAKQELPDAALHSLVAAALGDAPVPAPLV